MHSRCSALGAPTFGAVTPSSRGWWRHRSPSLPSRFPWEQWRHSFRAVNPPWFPVGEPIFADFIERARDSSPFAPEQMDCEIKLHVPRNTAWIIQRFRSNGIIKMSRKTKQIETRIVGWKNFQTSFPNAYSPSRISLFIYKFWTE